MTTQDYGTPSGAEPGGTREQAQQAAETAKQEGQHVAEVARSEAEQVASEAKAQASNLMSEARTQIEEQSRTQLDRLVDLLQSFGDDLERMVRGEGPSSDMARDAVTQVSQRAKSFSSQIQGREPAELLDEVRSFARRKPGTFLLGALAAGVVAGRLTRGAREARSSEDQTRSTSLTPTATTPTATPAVAPPAASGARAPGYMTGDPATLQDAPVTSAPTTGGRGVPPAPGIHPTGGTP